MNKWLALAVVFVLTSGAFAQGAQPGAEAFKRGQEAMSKQDYAAAIPALETAIKENPDLFVCNLWLGYAYKSKSNWNKVASNLLTYLDKAPETTEVAEQRAGATRELGVALARSNQATKAISYLDSAVSAKPNDVEAQFWLGMSLMLGKQEGRSEQVFSKVIQLSPKVPLPYYYAGRINFNRQEWDSAHQRLSKFLELKPDDPQSPEAHFMVGSIEYRKAEGAEDPSPQFAVVKGHLTTFLAAKPDAPQAAEAHYILGYIAAHSEDNETAKSHFETFLKLRPEGPQADEAKRFLEELKQSAER